MSDVVVENFAYLEDLLIANLHEHGADLHLEHNSTSLIEASNGEIVCNIW